MRTGLQRWIRMGYRATGRSEATFVDREVARSFIPFPLPPSAPPIRVAGALADRYEAARRATSRLELAVRLLPDPTPVVDAFLAKEAVLSCRIAELDATLRDVLLTAPRIDASPVGVVHAYLDAGAYGRAELADPEGVPLSGRLLNAIHRRLLKGSSDSFSHPGEVRTSATWAGGRPGYTELLPPPPRVLPELLTALERYFHADDALPPLVRVGLVHAQIQTIQPYLGGNGRLSRILTGLLLQHWGVLSEPVLYPSRYFSRRRAEYYRRLSSVRVDGDWEGWLGFFLRGVATVAEDAVGSIGRLSALVHEDRERLLAAEDGGLAAVRLLESLPGGPVVTTATVMARLDVSKPTAGRAITALESAGILAEATGRRRDRVWIYERWVDRVGLGTET